MRARYRARYRTQLACGLGLLALYFTLASLSPLRLIEAQEVFPFFSWSLFSSPKSRATYYSLLLERERGATLPVAFETGGRFVRLVDSPLNRHVGLTKVLATYSRRARGGDDAAMFEVFRPQVNAIVHTHAARYHVYRTVYDPIELFRERRYREARYVGSYEVGRER